MKMLFLILPLILTSCVVEPVRRPVVIVSAPETAAHPATPVNYVP